ncbi:putative dnase1 protein [Erysiphe neolycopersici]|uniref:Putative dnase1 protein n=1 Tax=Erysiphe neolycopersici TaxID=212602 RepID=A0A420HEY4_9PEZI|nr:putative dnase1 protein [Erysiphe neolycopersici]
MLFLGSLVFWVPISFTAANSVHFVNQDIITRTIVFTPERGQPQISSVIIKGNSAEHKMFPFGWTGNWYSVSEGAADVPGILGEVRFDGFDGATFFDVSAIVNPNDNQGVKQLFPAGTNRPISGCDLFPCANVYRKSDDLQTLSTYSKDLICLLGSSQSKARRSNRKVMENPDSQTS